MIRYKTQKGFTIIEVVLVLAIAALIFLMVFIAFPALQRSQRDSARKNAVGTVLSAVTDYASTHRGSLPDNSSGIEPFVKELTSSNYVVEVSQALPGGIPDQAIDNIRIYKSLQCNDASTELIQASARQYAVITKLETGDAVYCQNG